MNILLIEPSYRNKYPPLGLMKLATYHKMRGDNVTFYKGKIKDLILTSMVQAVIQNWLDHHTDFPKHVIPCEEIRAYIFRGRKDALSIINDLIKAPETLQLLLSTRKAFTSKSYLNDPSWKWDRVYITTLFTFYWKLIIPTINQAKTLVKSLDQFYVGGVTATLLQDKIIAETGLGNNNFLTGLLDTPGVLDKEDSTIIDDLPLDYSILDEIPYQYKEQGNYYGYMTRGCIRRCPFCVVPIIEPKYRNYIPLKEKLEITRNLHGEQKHLLLLDNNVMASKVAYEKIITEIRDAGFQKGAKFDKPDYLTLNITQLQQGNTDRGRIIQTTKQLIAYLNKLPLSKYKENLISLYTQNNIFIDTQYFLPSVENLLETYQSIKTHYLQTFKPSKTLRYVDFNQGVDARLITDEKMRLLSQIAIRPLRIAFDNWDMERTYTKAITLAAKHGIKHLSNYLLYNYEDTPSELYKRMEHNVLLGKKLGVKIFSFPMKYHPVKDVEYFSNRTYMGKHWNRKYIRAIQLILNATKGKVSPNLQFFRHAFGSNEEEFYKILLMPDQYIFYRVKHTDNGSIERWWNEYTSLDDKDKEMANSIIFSHSFKTEEWNHLPVKAQRLLRHYC